MTILLITVLSNLLTILYILLRIPLLNNLWIKSIKVSQLIMLFLRLFQHIHLIKYELLIQLINPIFYFKNPFFQLIFIPSQLLSQFHHHLLQPVYLAYHIQFFVLGIFNFLIYIFTI